MHDVVAISGRVCAGKTTLATHLEREIPGHRVSTRELLQKRFSVHGRSELQLAGAELDRATAGRWVADAISKLASDLSVIVDAVRITGQLEGLRDCAATFHVHLWARPEVLEARYEQQRATRPALELSSYSAVEADPTEAQVDSLTEIADVVLDTSDLLPDRVAELALSVLTDAGLRRPLP
jgi:adenylosuccinate synthase